MNEYFGKKFTDLLLNCDVKQNHQSFVPGYDRRTSHQYEEFDGLHNARKFNVSPVLCPIDWLQYRQYRRSRFEQRQTSPGSRTPLADYSSRFTKFNSNLIEILIFSLILIDWVVQSNNTGTLPRLDQLAR